MNRTTRGILAAAAFIVALSIDSSAEIRFEPTEPASGEAFRIVFEGVWGDSCVPTGPRLEIHDRLLLVTFKHPDSGGCLSVVTPFTATIEGVRLDGGDYSLISRLDGETLVPLFEERQFHVTGASASIGRSPYFDATAGNRVIVISGSFPCSTSPCSPPEVFFGANRSPEVRRGEGAFLKAVTPPGQGLVDLMIRGETYSYTRVSGFQYVSREGWEALLLPVYIRDVIDGAFGSRWITELSVLNQNEEPLIADVDLLHIDGSCLVTCPGPPRLLPDVVESYLRLLLSTFEGDPPIALFYVRKEAADHVTGALRTRDFTRQLESWGCEIPIVRESDMKPVVTLVDVPREERFRQKLRIYNPRLSDLGVRVEFFDTAGPLLASRDILLAWPNGSQGGINPPGYSLAGSQEFPLQPAYAEIDLASIPELEGHPRIWIRVTARGALRIWAFVSITNDETQQVSTVTPQ